MKFVTFTTLSSIHRADCNFCKEGSCPGFGLVKEIGGKLTVVCLRNLISRNHNDCGFSNRSVENMIDLIEQWEIEPVKKLLQLALTTTEPAHLIDLKDAQLCSPILRPPRNPICVAQNYKEHLDELKRATPQSEHWDQCPALFTKPFTSIRGPFEDLEIDFRFTKELDWETELAVVIGKKGYSVSEDDAHNYIFGYMVANDITARDLQRTHRMPYKGKSLDASLPLGPFLITKDEIPDVQNLKISTTVNGVIKQSGNTKDMIFSCSRLISEVSRGSTIVPGDTILTGTPAGVGASTNTFLKEGDVLRSCIENIGEMANLVRAKVN